MDSITEHPAAQPGKGISVMQIFGMILISVVVAIIATVFAIKIFLFPKPFQPVVLSDKEAKQLATKLEIFEGFSAKEQAKQSTQPPGEFAPDGSLKPEKYSEAGATRQILFNERELNAMLAKNTDLAEKMAIDLAQDMISIKLLIPLDPDFPIMGGKTLKVKAGAELAYRNGRPVVKLKGVSLMGVPMPNSWLGGIKNMDSG